jgi:hypothetical protein
MLLLVLLEYSFIAMRNRLRQLTAYVRAKTIDKDYAIEGGKILLAEIEQEEKQIQSGVDAEASNHFRELRELHARLQDAIRESY